MIANRFRSLVAPALVIIISGFLMISSVRMDSATFDEPEHITAAYSYLKFFDLRFNPWHPPLAKDIAALPLLFLDLKFPIDSRAWKERRRLDIADEFLYGVGNDVDQILFWSRLPLILAFCFFLAFFYRENRLKFGASQAFIALGLVAASPVFLANARYVTTDVAAAIGCFVGLTTYLKFLRQPSWSKAALTGLVSGLCFLLKFSVLVIVPVCLLLTVIWVAVRPGKFGKSWLLALQAASIYLLAFTTVAIVYFFQMWNFPLEMQAAYNGRITDWSSHALGSLVLATQDMPFFRGVSWYVTGLGRVLGYITQAPEWPMYVRGESYHGGRWYYFPLIWLLKESVTLHIFSLIAVTAVLGAGLRTFRGSRLALRLSDDTVFTIFSFAILIVSYWTFALFATINIGLRHVLPTIPFIAVIVSYFCTVWVNESPTPQSRRIRALFISTLLAWHFLNAFLTWPGYLGSFNVLAGSRETHRYWSIGADLDWGQDLRRLAKFVDDKGIAKISVRYFGGGKPEYYLGEKFAPLRAPGVKPVPGEFIAVSVHLLEMTRAKREKGIATRDDEWIAEFDHAVPIALVGDSIQVFQE